MTHHKIVSWLDLGNSGISRKLKRTLSYRSIPKISVSILSNKMRSGVSLTMEIILSELHRN